MKNIGSLEFTRKFIKAFEKKYLSTYSFSGISTSLFPRSPNEIALLSRDLKSSTLLFTFLSEDLEVLLRNTSCCPFWVTACLARKLVSLVPLDCLSKELVSLVLLDCLSRELVSLVLLDCLSRELVSLGLLDRVLVALLPRTCRGGQSCYLAIKSLMI